MGIVIAISLAISIAPARIAISIAIPQFPPPQYGQVHRIKAERDILATAEHPYVVKLYYSFASREHLYLVMEFVNGGDLLSLLRAVGYLDELNARQ